MMKKLMYLAALFSISSCEMVVDVDVPVPTPKLTLNATFTPDSAWQIQLHKSKYVLDDAQYQPVTNAQVVIKENGQTIDVLHHVDFAMYRSSSGKTPEIGKIYEIEASATGLETVSASSTLPQAVPIDRAVLEFRDPSGGSMHGEYSVDVTFRDVKGEENYYEFELTEYYFDQWNQSEDTVWYEYPAYISTEDVSFIQDGIEGVMFDDKLIDGREVKLTIKTWGMVGSNSKYKLTMRSLTKDLYRYKLTSSLQMMSSGDPFAQPVHVHNNIENGFGIFGGYSESHIMLKN